MQLLRAKIAHNLNMIEYKHISQYNFNKNKHSAAAIM